MTGRSSAAISIAQFLWASWTYHLGDIQSLTYFAMTIMLAAEVVAAGRRGY